MTITAGDILSIEMTDRIRPVYGYNVLKNGFALTRCTPFNRPRL